MTASVALRGPTSLQLRTRDGVTLAAWRWSPSGTPRAAVVLVHGFVGRGDSPDLRGHASALVDHGYEVVTYDARGHGGSGGACTLGALERHDVAAAVRAARQRTSAVVVVAESAGGTAALGHASSHQDVAGVVTVGAPAAWTMKRNLRAVAAAVMTRTGAGRWLARRFLQVVILPGLVLPEAPHVMAARLRAPLAVVHGTNDPFIPAREARELHGGATGPARLDLVAAMGHGFGPGSVEPVRSAVAWVLAQS